MAVGSSRNIVYDYIALFGFGQRRTRMIISECEIGLVNDTALYSVGNRRYRPSLSKVQSVRAFGFCLRGKTRYGVHRPPDCGGRHCPRNGQPLAEAGGCKRFK